MDLSTQYLGFDLATPVIPGASPMCRDLTTVKALEDAGAPMIVMHSVFQEQLELEQAAVNESLDLGLDSFPEASSYLPDPVEFKLGADEYLELIGRLKKSVSIPVIASINGRSEGWWVEYARLIQQAGADGLELNIYNPVMDIHVSSFELERETLDLVAQVRKSVKLPLAVKLLPGYTAFGNFARQLAEIGIDALVLFNRLFQPDFDIERLVLRREMVRSSSDELLPRLSAVAALAGEVDCDLAVSGGVHQAEDVVKATMAGANAVQMVTALMSYGPLHLEEIHDELASWLEAHQYESLSQARGILSLRKSQDRAAFERTSYMQILHSWERT